ncbi:MAG: CBS domain-containing protein [Nocardioides sp.]|nr:CBS domain-containing protein [Nocardioides sp.]
MKINDVVKSKASQEVVTIRPDAGVRELLRILSENNIGAVVVSADGEHVDGIVSERDVVRTLHADGTVINAQVSQIMTSDVRTCHGDDAVEELMQVMTQSRVRHIPVLADDRLVGIISIGDVVKNRIDQLEFERDQLDSYVHQT